MPFKIPEPHTPAAWIIYAKILSLNVITYVFIFNCIWDKQYLLDILINLKNFGKTR